MENNDICCFYLDSHIFSDSFQSMVNTRFIYNIKLATIYGMLLGSPIVASGHNQSIWDKIKSTPMSEKLAIAQKNYDRARLENICITRKSVKEYIKTNIKDVALADFMNRCITMNGDDYYNDLTIIINPHAEEMISDIKSNYKWFDDLMKYLSGKYTDEEFYKTGFFNTINKPSVSFIANTYDLKRWQGFIDRNQNSR